MSDPSICVAPLTPTYSTLPRINTTVLLLFVLLSPTSSWATKGALAALMARVATISIHAIVMLAMRDLSHPLELDAISAWFILSEIAVAAPIILSWAPALRGSKARLLVKVWALLVFVGAICGFVVVQWAQAHADERTCPAGAEPDQSMIFTRREVFTKLSRGALLGRFDIAAIAAASFGLISLLPDGIGRRTSTPSTARQLIKFAKFATLGLSSVVLVSLIVLHEQYLLGAPKLPMLLPVTSYEQWSCWAAAAFIILATVFNWALGLRKGSSTKEVAIQPGHLKHSTTFQGDDPLARYNRAPVEQWQTYSAAQAREGKSWQSTKADTAWTGIVGRPTPSYIN